MADTGGENIGGINVNIGADYSDLKSSFAEAQTLASEKGKDIADALAAGADAGANLGEQIASQFQAIGPAAAAATAAMEPFEAKVTELVESGMTLGEAIAAANASLGDTVAAAGSASSSVDGLATSTDVAAVSAQGLTDAEVPAAAATESLSVSANEAQSKLGEMAEKLAALAEALVITEGLREFGAEAATASDNVTKADIALTKLTGDGIEAKDTIDKLDALGMADGLSFPSLLTAATRMTALLPEGTNVSALLAKIADGAAVMGTDIVSAADKFDRMISAGTASARILTSLGVSMAGLADAINTVTHSEDATADSAAKAFKALDQSQRIDVLTAALTKMGGTASQVANQTFGGEWVRLANAWDAVMIQAGDAIKPVVAGLAEFMSLEVVPFLQELGKDFNALPVPVKDAAVALVLVTAATAPLLAGFAGISLAVSGLAGIVPALTGVLETFGITAGEVAIEEGAATVATEALGAAAVTAEGELSGAGAAAGTLAGALAGGLAAAMVASAALWVDYRMKLDAAQLSLKGIIPDFDKWLAAQVTGAKTSTDLAKAEDEVNQSLENGLITTQKAAAMLEQLTAASKALLATDVKSMLDGMGVSLHIVSDGTQKATDNLSLLKAVLDTTAAAQAKVNAEYLAGKRPAEDLISANNSLAAAQKKYSDALAASQPDGYVDGLKKIATQAQITSAQEDVLANHFALLTEAALIAGQRLVDLDTEAKALAASTADGTAKNSDYLAKLKEVAAAADDYKAKQEALNQAKLDAQPIDAVELDDAKRLGIQMNITGESVATTTNKLGEFGIILTNTVIPAEENTGTATDLVTQALKRQADESVAATADVDALTASYQSMASVLDEVSAAFQNVGSSQNITLKGQTGYTLQVSNTPGGGFSVQEVPTPATALKLAEQAARDNADVTANPKGLTDPISVERQILAEAQAVLPVIEAAFEAGNAGLKASDVQSAQQAVTSAQTELTKLLGGSATATGGTATVATTSAASSTISSAPVSTASSGGSYPGVVIHQAAGETLYVTMANSGTAGGISSGTTSASGGDTSSLIASTSATTANAVTTAASTMALVVSSLDAITGALEQTSAANAAAAASAYQSARLATGNGTTVVGGNPLATTATGSGATSTTGATGYGNSIGGNPLTPGLPTNSTATPVVSASGSSYIAYPGVPQGGNYIAPTPLPGAGGGQGGLQTASVHLTFNGPIGGGSASEIKAMLSDVVPTMVIKAVRQSGARV